MNPSLSVIIPAYNAEKYLEEAVSSVRSQNWPGETEIIVIDDGSTDATVEIAGSLGVTLLRKNRGGAASARNEGLAKASGELVLLLDADDLLSDGALEAMYRALEEHGADAVFAQTQDFISPELPMPRKQSSAPGRPPIPAPWWAAPFSAAGCSGRWECSMPSSAPGRLWTG